MKGAACVPTPAPEGRRAQRCEQGPDRGSGPRYKAESALPGLVRVGSKFGSLTGKPKQAQGLEGLGGWVSSETRTASPKRV